LVAVLLPQGRDTLPLSTLGKRGICGLADMAMDGLIVIFAVSDWGAQGKEKRGEREGKSSGP